MPPRLALAGQHGSDVSARPLSQERVQGHLHRGSHVGVRTPGLQRNTCATAWRLEDPLYRTTVRPTSAAWMRGRGASSAPRTPLKRLAALPTPPGSRSVSAGCVGPWVPSGSRVGGHRRRFGRSSGAALSRGRVPGAGGRPCARSLDRPLGQCSGRSLALPSRLRGAGGASLRSGGLRRCGSRCGAQLTKSVGTCGAKHRHASTTIQYLLSTDASGPPPDESRVSVQPARHLQTGLVRSIGSNMAAPRATFCMLLLLARPPRAPRQAALHRQLQALAEDLLAAEGPALATLVEDNFEAIDAETMASIQQADTGSRGTHHERLRWPRRTNDAEAKNAKHVLMVWAN